MYAAVRRTQYATWYVACRDAVVDREHTVHTSGPYLVVTDPTYISVHPVCHTLVRYHYVTCPGRTIHLRSDEWYDSGTSHNET